MSVDSSGGAYASPSCEHTSAIQTPRVGVVELAGRFFLDLAGCAADTARVAGALDGC